MQPGMGASPKSEMGSKTRMSEAPGHRGREVVKVRERILILLIVAVTGVFAPTLRHGFTRWDDNFNVVENPALNPVTVRSFAHFWLHPMAHYMHPLTYTMWATEAALAAREPDGRLKPFVFHLANLLLHVGATVLVFYLLRLILIRGSPRPDPEPDPGRTRVCDMAALCGALLFGLHPVQVEPVAWVTGGRDLLSGILALAALVEYVTYAIRKRVDCASSVAASGERDAPHTGRAAALRRHGVAATCFFLLAVTAKPTAVSVPLMAVLLGTALLPPGKEAAKRGWLALLRAHAWPLCWLLPALPWAVFTKLYQRDALITFVAPLWARPLIALDAMAFYAFKLVFPFRLGPEYGRSPTVVLEQGWLFATWIVPVGLAVLAWRTRPGRRGWWLGIGLFTAFLLPVLGLVPFRFQGYSTVADRYLYLAMLGPALALAWALARWPAILAGRAGRCALAMVFVALGVRSVQQSRIWRDDVALFSHALTVNPNSFVAFHNLGEAAQERGEWDKAIGYYLKGIEHREDYTPGYTRLGGLMAAMGRLDEAEHWFREALRVEPSSQDARLNLGAILAAGGRPSEAIPLFRQVLAVAPRDAGAHYNLGLTLAGMDRVEDAIRHYSAALAADPSHWNARNNIGILLKKAGRTGAEIRNSKSEIRNKSE